MFKYGGQSASTAFNNDQDDDIGASILNPPNISPLVKAATWYKQINRLHIIVGFAAVLFVGSVIGLSIYFGGSSKVEPSHSKHHHHHPSHDKPQPPSEPYSLKKPQRKIKDILAMGLIDYYFKTNQTQYYFYECKECPANKTLVIGVLWGCQLTVYKPDTTTLQTGLFYGKKKKPAQSFAAENAVITLFPGIEFDFKNKTKEHPKPENPPDGLKCKELQVYT